MSTFQRLGLVRLHCSNENSTKGADALGEFQLAASILFIHYSELMQTEAKQVLINLTTFNQLCDCNTSKHTSEIALP